MNWNKPLSGRTGEIESEITEFLFGEKVRSFSYYLYLSVLSLLYFLTCMQPFKIKEQTDTILILFNITNLFHERCLFNDHILKISVFLSFPGI